MRWRARYSDGTWLDQSLTGESVYPLIDRTKLAAFDILKDIDDPKAEYETTELLFRMWLEDKQKLIYRYRPRIDIATGHKVSEVWLVGYQEKINGKNKQVINYVFPDGHIEQAGKWIGGMPQIREEEKLDG